MSALTRDGLDLLEKEILALLPEGPQYFPEDMITDLPEQFLVEELIREKVFRLLSKEVPYAAAVTVDSFRRREDKPIIHIQATIHVERDSQKGILIGKGGQLLKKIGQSARESMEPLLGSQVFLELWVRVEKNWRKNPKLIRRFGYEGERCIFCRFRSGRFGGPGGADQKELLSSRPDIQKKSPRRFPGAFFVFWCKSSAYFQDRRKK